VKVKTFTQCYPHIFKKLAGDRPLDFRLNAQSGTRWRSINIFHMPTLLAAKQTSLQRFDQCENYGNEQEIPWHTFLNPRLFFF
jgi:hypothetical protein